MKQERNSVYYVNNSVVHLREAASGLLLKYIFFNFYFSKNNKHMFIYCRGIVVSRPYHSPHW